jgi:hypothetical protein
MVSRLAWHTYRVLPPAHQYGGAPVVIYIFVHQKLKAKKTPIFILNLTNPIFN